MSTILVTGHTGYDIAFCGSVKEENHVRYLWDL